MPQSVPNFTLSQFIIGPEEVGRGKRSGKDALYLILDDNTSSESKMWQSTLKHTIHKYKQTNSQKLQTYVLRALKHRVISINFDIGHKATKVLKFNC